MNRDIQRKIKDLADRAQLLRASAATIRSQNKSAAAIKERAAEALERRIWKLRQYGAKS